MRTVRTLLACGLWLPAALGIGLAARALVPPYVLWSYVWHGPTAGPVTHSSCTYLGFGSTITARPVGGRCAWVRFAGWSR